MGLISRAQRVSSEPLIADSPLLDSAQGSSKKKSGLLQRVATASSYDAVGQAFRDFLNAAETERAGILFSDEASRMAFLFPAGFDYTTARRLTPQYTQIKAIADSTEWVSITGRELEDWRSFFSSHELRSLQSLKIRAVPLEDASHCCVVLAKSLLDIRREDGTERAAENEFSDLCSAIREHIALFRALAPVESVNKSVEAMRYHAESALSAKKRASLVTISCQNLNEDEIAFQTDQSVRILYNAITHQIARLVGSTNIINATPSGTIRIVLFTALPNDSAFYFSQLMKPLERLFGVDRVKRLTVSDSRTAPSLSGILDFLTGEN
ncbi:MAG TPA: hypothetical protein PK542_05560 [Treponemataceae bacterium]|nr:hypothetical protein [Treponemataceae bacterium]HPS43933.1 hypothetical protein [Treponemataceae bacterium]